VESRLKKKLKRLSRRNEPYITLVLIGLALLIQYRSGQFFTANNLVSLASAFIVPGLFAIGAYLVLVSGGIDVSFPALASLSVYMSTVFVIKIGYEGGAGLPFLIAIVLGALLGAFNGLFVGVF